MTAEHKFDQYIHFYTFVLYFKVAGKKGKMMERRILKDFQIGIVETIVSEAVKNTAGGDVFSSIAKAMKTRRSTHKRFVDILQC